MGALKPIIDVPFFGMSNSNKRALHPPNTSSAKPSMLKSSTNYELKKKRGTTREASLSFLIFLILERVSEEQANVGRQGVGTITIANACFACNC